MSTIPYRAPQRPQATPDAVLAYCEAGHTNTQAAEYFDISDRYVRKLKNRARGDTDMGPTVPTAAIRPIGPSVSSLSPTVAPESSQPSYATIHASAIADGDCMWKCPKCGDLHHPIPGTTGATWAATGCYLCATPRRASIAHGIHAPFVMSSHTERHDATDAPVATGPEEQDRPPEHEETRPSLVVPGRNTEHTAAPQVGTVPVEQPPIVYRERVVTRVVRVPVESQRAGVLSLVADHLPPVQVLVAVLIALVLVGVASLG